MTLFSRIANKGFERWLINFCCFASHQPSWQRLWQQVPQCLLYFCLVQCFFVFLFFFSNCSYLWYWSVFIVKSRILFRHFFFMWKRSILHFFFFLYFICLFSCLLVLLLLLLFFFFFFFSSLCSSFSSSSASSSSFSFLLLHRNKFTRSYACFHPYG